MFNTVDLFCGAGGFTEGFRKAGGFNNLFAVDSDFKAIKTLTYNHSKITGICADVSDLDANTLTEFKKNQKVDVVIGGPPCQGFSLAGRRLPDDPKNKLFLEYVRIVRELKPKVVVFENVVGLISMQGGLVLEAICEEFFNAGYEVVYDILNAADYGVPQARPRFILIGRYGKGSLSMPQHTHISANKAHTKNLFLGELIPHVTVKDALSDLPKIKQGEGFESIKFTVNAKNSFQESMRGDRSIGVLFNHRATKHSPTIVERYDYMPQGGDIKSLPERLRTKKNNVFRLLDSIPSRTITCNFRTDIIHPSIPRGLTVREAARLQSFDDDYCFFGNLTRKAKYLTQDDQVGNAVPPLLAKAIANHIKEYL